MKLLDSNEDLRQVEQCGIHGQTEVHTNLLHQLTARQVFKEKVQVGLVLQGLVEIDKKASFGRILEVLGQVVQNLFLILYVLDMLVTLHSFFRNLLHCIDFSGQTMLHKTHVSKATATKQAKRVEVFEAETFRRTGLLDHVHGGTWRLLLLKVTGTIKSTGRLVWCNKALLDGHLCSPILPFEGPHFNWLINDLWNSAHLFRWCLIDSCFANMPNLK